MLGAIEYFERFGREFGATQAASLIRAGYTGRRLLLKQGLAALQSNELDLSCTRLAVLEAVPGLQIYGVTDPDKLDQRVAAFSFRLKDPVGCFFV